MRRASGTAPPLVRGTLKSTPTNTLRPLRARARNVCLGNGVILGFSSERAALIGFGLSLRGSRGQTLDLQLVDEQEIDDAEGFIGVMNNHSAAAGGMREELAVGDEERSAIGHVNHEWPKWSGLVDVTKLFDGHRSP